VKITKVNSLPEVSKFKNKEEFSNRIVQEVLSLSVSNNLFDQSNKKITGLQKYKKELFKKNERLDGILQKSKEMKEDFSIKIDDLNKSNIQYKNRLLEMLHPGG